MNSPVKTRVRLTDAQRQEFERTARDGRTPAKKARYARLLLHADEAHPDGRRSDAWIADALGMHVNTVARVRKDFADGGAGAAFGRKPREHPPVPPKIDGRVEAHLIAMQCGPPPEGRARWTLKLLAAELQARQLVTEVCIETVRRALRRNELKPWLRTETWCIPERDAARFVAQREQVLDVYAIPPTDEVPTICMDEAAKQLLEGLHDPPPAGPGRAAREDYHYARKGVQALFLFFDPHRGWRRVSCRDSRTRQDWAHEVRRLLDEDYPTARTVRLVCDNLNIHNLASLYATFPAAEAHRLARRLEIVHTPRNGSWLNVAEIELSALARQCLDRRIGAPEELASECAAWERARNAEGGRVIWKFTTADARVKLRHLYLQI